MDMKSIAEHSRQRRLVRERTTQNTRLLATLRVEQLQEDLVQIVKKDHG